MKTLTALGVAVVLYAAVMFCAMVAFGLAYRVKAHLEDRRWRRERGIR